MDAILERCCGLDVHRDTVVACLLTGSLESRPKKEIRTFSTMSKGLHELLDWLTASNCTHVAMESTGVYWKPVYHVLEETIQIKLANAQRIKNVPGRKTDIADSEWIAKLLRSGLIEGSFVPPADIRALRELTRHRKKLVSHASAEKNRIQKTLESGGIKLASVISDVFGVSGRALLEQIIHNGFLGQDVVESLVKGPIKKKIPQLMDALSGTLSTDQRFLLQQSWDHLRYLEQSLVKFDARIDEHLESYRLEIELIRSIPGIDSTSAAAILAEIGADMLQFHSDRHLASWAGLSPGNNESAGVQKSARISKGNPHIKCVLVECAWAASRTKRTYLASKYWKLASRRGKKKALIALAHKMLTIVYHLLLRQQPYLDLGEDYLDHLVRDSKAKRLLRQLQLLGYTIPMESHPNEAS